MAATVPLKPESDRVDAVPGRGYPGAAILSASSLRHVSWRSGAVLSPSFSVKSPPAAPMRWTPVKDGKIARDHNTANRV
jgi:hypothetical protein